MTHRILVIDDDPKILETCRSVLAPEANVAGEELQAMADSLFGTQRVAPEEGVGKVRPTKWMPPLPFPQSDP